MTHTALSSWNLCIGQYRVWHAALDTSVYFRRLNNIQKVNLEVFFVTNFKDFLLLALSDSSSNFIAFPLFCMSLPVTHQLYRVSSASCSPFRGRILSHKGIFQSFHTHGSSEHYRSDVGPASNQWVLSIIWSIIQFRARNIYSPVVEIVLPLTTALPRVLRMSLQSEIINFPPLVIWIEFCRELKGSYLASQSRKGSL